MLTPEWFEKSLTNFRGSSIYGDPVLRVVWGADQRDFRGRNKYVYAEGGAMQCFILERWQPAGFFGSREVWENRSRFYDDVSQEWTNLKGPFPERGAYTMICPIVGSSGQYVPLDETAMMAIKIKITDDEDFAELQIIERNRLIVEQQSAVNAEVEARADKRQDDLREYFLTNKDKINRSAATGYSITPR